MPIDLWQNNKTIFFRLLLWGGYADFIRPYD